LQSSIDRLHHEGKLRIIEATVPAPGCYHLGDVYVYPSRLDGIGLTIAEALSCGLPVIVPDTPPMNEFVGETNGQKVAIGKLYSRSDGYYWPQCEVDLFSLIQKMQWYIDRQDHLALFKKQARDYAEAKLDWGKHRKAVIEIFKEMRPIAQCDTNDIIAFENKRAKNNLLLRLYMGWPTIYRLLNLFISLKCFRLLLKAMTVVESLSFHSYRSRDSIRPS
jgi:1,2-diacylglycerol 3-alpha-glucosyltransferase